MADEMHRILAKYPGSKKNGAFADFFLHATPEEKSAVIRRAAEGANRDQMATFKRANLKLKMSEQV